MENLKVYCGGEIIDQWGTFKRNKRDIPQEIKWNGKDYILTRIMDGTYNKALRYQNLTDSTHYILISYNTVVAEIKGDKFIIHGYFSETTKRHINDFLDYFGLVTMSKKEILQNSYKWLECKNFVKKWVEHRFL